MHAAADCLSVLLVCLADGECLACLWLLRTGSLTPAALRELLVQCGDGWVVEPPRLSHLFAVRGILQGMQSMIVARTYVHSAAAMLLVHG